MPALHIILEGDGAAADIPLESLRSADETKSIRVALLKGGMSSGEHSVTLLVPMPDGTTVFAQTSLKLFFAAAAAFKGRLDYEESQRVRHN